MAVDIALAVIELEMTTIRGVGGTVESATIVTRAAIEETPHAKSRVVRRTGSRLADETTVEMMIEGAVGVGVEVVAVVPRLADVIIKSLRTVIAGLGPPPAAHLVTPIVTVVSSLHLRGGERTVAISDLTLHPATMRSQK